MKIKALQAIGLYKVGDVIDVIADDEFDKLVQAKKALVVLSKSRADAFLTAGVAELLEHDEPKAKTEPKPKAKTDKSEKNELQDN